MILVALIWAVKRQIGTSGKFNEDDLLKKHGLDSDSLQGTLERAREIRAQRELLALDFIDETRDLRTQKARPVIAMTAMYLPRIIEDFPEFNFEETKERAEMVITSYLRAINLNDVSLLKYGSKQLEEILQARIDMNLDEGRDEKFDFVKINRTEISKYIKSSGRYIITMQSSVECLHYILKDSIVIYGSKKQKYQTRFEMTLVYIQDADLVENDSEKAWGLTCPNCGAPVKTLGRKICEYCNCNLIEYNLKTFSFISVEEK